MNALHSASGTGIGYNPGVTYQGGQLLAQGIGQAAHGLADGLMRYSQMQEERKTLLNQLAPPPTVNSPEGVPEQPVDWTGLGRMEGPNEGTGEGDATEAMKKAAKVTQALRTIGEHAYGYSRDQLSTMSLGELSGLAKKHVEDENRREKEQAMALNLARFNQEAQHQATQEALQKNLQDVMLPYHREQTANLVNAREQEQALGNALATFGRGGTVVDAAPNALAQWADRAMTYNGGQVPPPELSRELSYSERLNRALQTPGLGGTGAVRLTNALERFQPKEVSELDRATIALRNAQAMKAMQELNGPGTDNTPVQITMPDGTNLFHQPGTKNPPLLSPFSKATSALEAAKERIQAQAEARAERPTITVQTKDERGNMVTRHLTPEEFSALPKTVPLDVAKQLDDLAELHKDVNEKGRYRFLGMGDRMANRDALAKTLRRAGYGDQVDEIIGQQKAPDSGSAPAASPAVALPKVGEERKGYIYQGGDPSQPSSWKRK